MNKLIALKYEFSEEEIQTIINEGIIKIDGMDYIEGFYLDILLNFYEGDFAAFQTSITPIIREGYYFYKLEDVYGHLKMQYDYYLYVKNMIEHRVSDYNQYLEKLSLLFPEGTEHKPPIYKFCVGDDVNQKEH